MAGGEAGEHTLMSLGGCLHAAAGGQKGVKQFLNAAFNYRAGLTFTAVTAALDFHPLSQSVWLLEMIYVFDFNFKHLCQET